MKYEIKIHHQAIILISLLLYIISPNQAEWVSKEKKTGEIKQEIHAEVQIWGTSTWTIQKDSKQWLLNNAPHKQPMKDCWVSCKINTLTWIGIHPIVAKRLVKQCKDTATDPRNCIIVGSFIIMAESGGCNTNKNKNCFWIRNHSFDTYDDSVTHWTSRYNHYWYNQTTPSSFYSKTPWVLPKTRYCVDEGTKNYCPNWYKNSMDAYNKLEKVF
jgi:hypothetical protein